VREDGIVLVKKYGNRRLYDTAASRYITLEELAAIVKSSDDVRVVDAKTGEDLTTSTLAQIIVEGRGAARLLPRPLLVQLIRMGDDALAEFFGQYVTWALQAYLQTKQSAQAMSPFNPFFTSPFAGGGLSRMFGLGSTPPPAEPPPQPPLPGPGGNSSSPPSSELHALRRELEELKKSLKKRRR
jgi:polyhydroxyalkanoate synthesis repressor PhaR